MEATLLERRYTYEEWLELDTGDVRTELVNGYLYPLHVQTEIVNGEVYSFSAASLSHQIISRKLTVQFDIYLQGRTCQVFPTINVRLEDDVLFIPDLVVVCDKNKLSEKGCKGAPDLIIEILSPSTSRHDRITKQKAYRRAGVKEYWIVYPEEHSIETHILVNDMYSITRYTEGTIPVSVLDDFTVDLSSIFE